VLNAARSLSKAAERPPWCHRIGRTAFGAQRPTERLAAENRAIATVGAGSYRVETTKNRC